MTTGYTSDLSKGEQSFEDFVLTCARAFGAYVHLRDEPDVGLSKIPDDTLRYQRDLDKAQERYNEFTELSEEEQMALYQEYVESTTERNAKSRQERLVLAERYGKMLGKVIAWNPPKELDNLKSFMKEQLESSIDFDCKVFEHKVVEFYEWLDDRVEYLQRCIENREKDLEREKTRIKEQHAWHEALMKASKDF